MSANDRRGKALMMVLLSLVGSAWLVQGCGPKQANDFIDQALPAFYGQVVTVPQNDPTPPVATLKIPN